MTTYLLFGFVAGLITMGAGAGLLLLWLLKKMRA